MGKIVISENVPLDGVIQDPAGDEGFRRGGWVGRIGPPRGGQGRARRGAGRRGAAAGPAKLRVARRPVAIPKIFPVMLGAGERLFGETSDKKLMRLLDTQTLEGGVAILTYELVRDA